MRRIRVIPVLLLKGNGLYKTIKFSKPNYIGDPINAVKIFNEKEVDEIIILDIECSLKKKEPNFRLIKEIAGECFMPLAYGGGITTLDHARELFSAGVEKIIINSAFYKDPEVISRIAHHYGSQSVVVSVDYKNTFLSGKKVFVCSATRATGLDPISYCQKAENFGAGELIVNSIDKDGTRTGYDLEFLKSVCSAVRIPVVALGGAYSNEDFYQAVVTGGASAVAAGSMFVYKGGINSILINYSSSNDLRSLYQRL